MTNLFGFWVWYNAPMSSPFVHLRAHSHYSLLEGLSKIDEMIARVKEYGYEALALTDLGNLHGAIEFYKECGKAGIKPIIGVDMYMTPGSRNDKRAGIDTERHIITLLAADLTGYKNLIKLVTASFLEGYYYKPRIDKELLSAHAEGVMCIAGGLGSEIAKALGAGSEARAADAARALLQIFGDRFYIEIHPKFAAENYAKIRDSVKALAKNVGVPLVATIPSFYLHPEDRRAHETLLSVQQNRFGSDVARFISRGDDFSFADPARVQQEFADVPGAVAETAALAARVNLTLELGNWVFPHIEVPPGATHNTEIKRLAYEGVKTRGLTATEEITKRLEYELDIITQKGYAPYFLVVADLLRYAREHGILSNTRGSAAGSFVSYTLGITNINPIEYILPFERFLNPERPSPPDIDMDLADNRRDEVIEYARQTYGADKVAQIGTFGTMLAKGAVRDVARALRFPYEVGDKISRLIPPGAQGFPMTIGRAMKETPELKTLYDSDADTKEIIDLAKRLEGCVRHVSVHAAGVVMAPSPLTDFVPLQLDPKGGKIITQYDMHAVEDAGLLKFDFLGITNLSMLAASTRLVKETRGIDIDVEKIPLDDKKTFAMLAHGDTMGVFQLGGGGMTRYLKDLRPTSIHDINAMVALYRPGPIENIPHYVARKHGTESITYLDPRLKDILERSYGIITYQDDVLLIAITLAGYSWLDADKLRKAMGKKIPEVMAAEKEKFVSGAVDHGLIPQKALILWQLIEPFAAYGFNKAHAASYGRLAYQTAYMKANFPVEYMTAVLSAEAGDVEKVAEVIAECKKMNIPVLPPDVNESLGDFAVIMAGGKGQALGSDSLRSDLGGTAPVDRIRFGLYTIKNLGTDISDAMIAERGMHGPYASFGAFLTRVKHKNVNKKSLEALIKSGAMDVFGERGVLLANMDKALTFNREGANASQDSLFGGAGGDAIFTLDPAEPADPDEKLAWEKELLGLYISGHPLDKFKEKLAKQKADIKTIKESVRPGAEVVVAGVIENIREITTKGGDAMAFVRVADYSGAIEVVLFPKTFTAHRALIAADSCIAVKGKLSDRNGEIGILADAVKKL